MTNARDCTDGRPVPQAAEGRLPDFLIIGAAKSGTTTLHRYLCLHPQIYMSPVKEPCFFDRDVGWKKGLDWYKSLFAGAEAGQVCGEASTNYTRFPQVPDVPSRVAATLPDVKLIYIMRDPIDRTYSHFLHRNTKELYRHQPFAIPFDEFIERDKMCVDSSEYAVQISQYRDYFPPEAFQFLFFEELCANPARCMREVFQFLQVDAEVDVVGSSPLHANNTDRHVEARVRERTTRFLREYGWLRSAGRRLPESWRSVLYRLLTVAPHSRRARRQFEPPPMSAETARKLADRFRESNHRLSELLGVDLSEVGWKDIQTPHADNLGSS